MTRTPLGDYVAELLAALAREEMDEGEVLELGVKTAKSAIEAARTRRLEVSSPIMVEKLQRAARRMKLFLRDLGESAGEENPVGEQLDFTKSLAAEDDE